MQQLVATLKPPLSPIRLERYRPNNGSDLDMMVNYYWNVALAESLLCSLSTVEIMLRNAIHDSLSVQLGTPNWFDQRGILETKQYGKLQSAKAHIRRNGRTVTPERIVSSLTFGFWVTLLSRPYDARLWRANRAQALRAAFPHVPKTDRQRPRIHSHYNGLLTLRNNAFHHEPLWDRSTISVEHAAIYTGIAWIDPAMVLPTRLFDRFPDTHSNGREHVETAIRKYLGMP